MDKVTVIQADREAAEGWSFIECRHCSEYEGDFVADLAASFAAHRLATQAPDSEKLREAGDWQAIETAPRDGTEFLSTGGSQGRAGTVYPTKYLAVGPYSTENGKNTPGERRFSYPAGFYWAGYDGFVGPVDPTHWTPFPAAPALGASA